MKEFTAKEMLSDDGARGLLLNALYLSRKRLGISPDEFSRMTDTPNIVDIERGKGNPPADLVLRLMTLLGVDIGVLRLRDLKKEHMSFWKARMAALGVRPLASSSGKISIPEKKQIQMFIRYRAVQELFSAKS